MTHFIVTNYETQDYQKVEDVASPEHALEEAMSIFTDEKFYHGTRVYRIASDENGDPEEYTFEELDI